MYERGAINQHVVLKCQFCGAEEERSIHHDKITCQDCKKKRKKDQNKFIEKVKKHKLECQYCKKTLYRKLKWRIGMTCKECQVKYKNTIKSTIVK